VARSIFFITKEGRKAGPRHVRAGSAPRRPDFLAPTVMIIHLFGEENWCAEVLATEHVAVLLFDLPS